MKTVIAHDAPFTDLDAVVAEFQQAYREAAPTPHCCIDGLVPDELLQEVLDEFPPVAGSEWRRVEKAGRSKGKSLATDMDSQFGPSTRYLFIQLGSPRFLGFLERLTGIQGLVPDPYLHAAGLHQIETGGFLDIHSDFATHPKLQLHRRVNLILYMNRDWEEGYRGHLELWDRDMTAPVAKYLPTWNRAVISTVSADAYHGFPERIQCPEGMTRKSLAAWYYTAERPQEEVEAYRSDVPSFKARATKRA